MGIASLDAALSGLRISQQQISVISNNVANVGTPGYTRKILPQSTQAINGVSVGVSPETILRVVDLNLSRDLWTQVSAVGQLEVQETYLQRIEQFHGPPDRELSIAAELGRLRDAFSILADTPEDNFALNNAVNQAEDVSNKINDLSSLISTLRNDAQDELEITITRINDLLVSIAEVNDQIEGNINVGRTTALLEDTRDEAVKELSELIDISFFIRGDGVMVVQTNRGVELAGDRAQSLSFSAVPLSPTVFYPDSVNGLFIGDPVTDPSAVDITTLEPGGKLQGLLELRDEIFPKQMAQLDELAHKTALRFEAQGLRLYTDASGSVPLDTAPDPTTLPNETPVPYVGFSSEIRVNAAILTDNSLIQTGTYGATLTPGSNEVIRRVLEYTFTDIDYLSAENTDTTTQVDLLNTGGADLQEWLGLLSSNEIAGGSDLSAIASVADLIASSNGALDPPNDEFEITFEEARTGLGPFTVTVDMAAAAGAAGPDALTQMVNYITGLLGAAPAGLDAAVSAGPNGELLITSRGSIEINATTNPNPMGQTGLNFLGLTDINGNPQAPTDPFFDIAVGNNDPTRIFLEPGETAASLQTKLLAVDGLAIDQDAVTGFLATGILRLRPSNDFDNPDFGGDITITSGNFETAGAGYSNPPALTGTRAALDNGANVVSALFGTYTLNAGNVQNESAVTRITYGSETDASLGPPIPTLPFREEFLGPGGDIETNIVGANSLIDFAQKMVNEQTQELILKTVRKEDEDSLRELLQNQLLDESGVNIDEELGNLIVVQTAYSASARVLSAVDELFQELLNAVRR